MDRLEIFLKKMAIGDQTVDYLIEIEPGPRILGVAKEYPDLTVF